MYTPSPFRVDDRDTLVAFMRRYSFCTLVSGAGDQLNISHVPVLVDVGATGVVLSGHLARANPHVAQLHGCRATAIFNGPHSYISPQWYADTREVPTWNYAAVHAAGETEIIEDSEKVSGLVDRMVAFYEPLYGAKWDRHLPPDYRESQLRHIVGFRLPVATLRGKFKLGQNRSGTDQDNMLAELETGAHPGSRELAAFIRQLRQPD